ncbi:DUF2635 domain-containing protein [Roseomonas aerophila]|uniref:DUF2635 domain-containing protein n=2 Tax=Teichococcus aerophilus TaxID=1224513 RepID=A0ABR7RRF9_9PROT|nr:DUF2635 domain-containing protein [Pseudoroseomonas aerophila]
MSVKPAPGLSVRDPVLRDLLPAEGRPVERSEYWLRRLADGDVVEMSAPPAVAPQDGAVAEPDATPADAPQPEAEA